MKQPSLFDLPVATEPAELEQEPAVVTPEAQGYQLPPLDDATPLWALRDSDSTAGIRSLVANLKRPVRIGLVPCSKQKFTDRPESLGCTVAAEQMYLGDLFAKAMRWAKATCDLVFILSAKYGLLLPRQRIQHYDLHLADTPASYRKEWGERVHARLVDLVLNASVELVCLAGAAYVDALPAMLTGGVPLHTPLKGLGLGEQKRWLVRNMPPPDPRYFPEGHCSNCARDQAEPGERFRPCQNEHLDHMASSRGLAMEFGDQPGPMIRAELFHFQVGEASVEAERERRAAGGKRVSPGRTIAKQRAEDRVPCRNACGALVHPGGQGLCRKCAIKASRG